MKKTLIFAAIAAISFGASAQLKVVTNGQTQVGTAPALTTIDPANPSTLASGSATNSYHYGVGGFWQKKHESNMLKNIASFLANWFSKLIFARQIETMPFFGILSGFQHSRPISQV